ncbi:hypothetical protein TNIN_490151 [Trichonephila inaurata madagascariensis]|uniref:Uncharacterized protein n=1 Tax=Trichonephila inaurata madagascariensis TaxID=2747483 RepID=A0A8X6KHC7_9ARAC|nr:hypothetical protein TNIN_490151 [Trichonephila inaurata madagascariensis]
MPSACFQRSANQPLWGLMFPPGAKPDFPHLLRTLPVVLTPHLAPRGQPPTTPGKGPTDLHDPQAAQNVWALERGNSRQLTSNNTGALPNCQDPPLSSPFSSVWQAPAVPLELKDFPPENPNFTKFSPLWPFPKIGRELCPWSGRNHV